MYKLTEMQEFALNILNENGGDTLKPGYLGYLWHVHKHGKHPDSASRDSWGTTTAAYKTLRKLHELGLANKHSHKTSGGYTVEQYSIKRVKKK